MQRSPEIEAAYARLLQAMSAGDGDGFVQRTAAGAAASLIGSAPGEIFKGDGAWEAVPTLIATFPAVGLRVMPGDPLAYADGVTGWLVDQPRWRTREGYEERTRLTAVFRREGGDWKLVHLHHSVGVPDDQVEIFRDVDAALQASEPG